MQYLTKSFHSKVYTHEGIKQTKIGIKDCIKKLNKWLAKPNQQDVKVDDFNFTTEHTTDYNSDNIKINYENDVTYQYPETICTRLIIVYHHE